jgi:hypothetical protein
MNLNHRGHREEAFSHKKAQKAQKELLTVMVVPFSHFVPFVHFCG